MHLQVDLGACVYACIYVLLYVYMNTPYTYAILRQYDTDCARGSATEGVFLQKLEVVVDGIPPNSAQIHSWFNPQG